MSTDHSECREEIRGMTRTHTCPPCPHGHVASGQITLRGDDRVDADQWARKMEFIHGLTCEDHEQVRAYIATRGRSRLSDKICAYSPMQYSDTAVNEAWERHGYEVGRGMHDAHRRDLLALGFAPHLFKRGKPGQGCAQPGCGQPRRRHHPDMVDWDHLPPGLQAATMAFASIAFTAGYRQGLAAHAWSIALGQRRGQEGPHQGRLERSSDLHGIPESGARDASPS